MVVHLVYKYRIYPSKKQKDKLINSLKECKIIYNYLLENSIKTYKDSGKTLRKYDYNKLIKGNCVLYSQVSQNISDRVHKAFSEFFRRVKDKSCKKKGFPRFKSRIHSFTYPQYGFKLLSDKKLRLSNIGIISIVLHRIIKGKIKTLTIKQNKSGQWFAIFSCENDSFKINHFCKENIGIDVGLKNFATLSNGEIIDNPRFLIKNEKKLKLLQRRFNKKKKKSKNRIKSLFKLSRHYLKITNQRRDFLHKLSNDLTFKYSIIAVENLNIKSMAKNHYLAKSIYDASWNIFIDMLSYKAVKCGGQVLKNPRTKGSSCRCSKCGKWINISLSKRIFKCPKCLNKINRDLNASINHLKDTVGLTEISTPVDIKPLLFRNKGQVR